MIIRILKLRKKTRIKGDESPKEMASGETRLWNTKGTIVRFENKVFKQNILSSSVRFEKEKHYEFDPQ